MRSSSLLWAGLVCLMACTSSETGTGMPDLGADNYPKDAIRLRIGPITLQPGEETTRCFTQLLPTTVPIDVVRIETKQYLTHHVIFYKYPQGTTTQPGQDSVKCEPLSLLFGEYKVPLFIGEQQEDSINMPAGVGYHFNEGEAYTIEGHFLNASATEKTAYADVVLIPAPQGSMLQYADMIFMNNQMGLDQVYSGSQKGLPPGLDTTLPPAFYGLKTDMNLFGVTTHQHQLGTRVQVSKSAGVDDAGEELITNTSWEHPSLALFDPPKTFKPGEGLRWVCSYKNTSTRFVKFGQSAKTDEMCITWGYYYPSQGFRIYWQ